VLIKIEYKASESAHKASERAYFTQPFCYFPLWSCFILILEFFIVVIMQVRSFIGRWYSWLDRRGGKRWNLIKLIELSIINDILDSDDSSFSRYNHIKCFVYYVRVTEPPQKWGVYLPRSYWGILDEARMRKHTHKYNVPNMKFKLKLSQIKCHVSGFTKDKAQNVLQKIIRVFVEAFVSLTIGTRSSP
jgi:hypothetical protein